MPSTPRAPKSPKDKAIPKDSSSSSRQKRGGLTSFLIYLLGFCCLVSVVINILHGSSFQHHSDDMAIARAMKDFIKGRKKINLSRRKEEQGDAKTKRKENEAIDNNIASSSLAGLSCEKFGGPAPEIAQEMVYWSDIPSDAQYVSPFRDEQVTRYMTFEPDGGGWNNIRMAMETVVGLAVAMGRTLVLPPEQRMYLLRKDMGKQRTHFSFAHFFPMLEIAQEHEGLQVITMEEFLKREAMTGHLRDKVSGEVAFPPDNRTDWNGLDNNHIKVLKEWLRNVTHTPLWKPGTCMAAFPASGDPHEVQHLEEIIAQVTREGTTPKTFEGKPIPVNASPKDRMAENRAGRSELCVYDQTMQKELVLHFMCYHKMRIRLLVHFYAFLYFEDWKQDLWMKRFIRDHVRYIDEIQCAAARVVHAVRQHALGNNPDSKGDFDSFHIRRGDFQFKTTRISAQEIYEVSKDVLTENKTVYIATDEKDKKFFAPLAQKYDLLFLDDFMHELEGVNSNYFGMLDQLVASRGNVFVGCWFSTFTGYINRIRGYRSVKDRLPGYKEGTLPTSYYYATRDKKLEMHKYAPVRPGFFNREFPTSWRDIDKGIAEIANI